MGNQAQELELWQVVSSPKSQNKQSRSNQKIQDSIKVIHPNAAGTRPRASRGQVVRRDYPRTDAGRMARASISAINTGQTARSGAVRRNADYAAAYRTTTGTTSKQRAYKTGARQMQSEYIVSDRRRTSDSRGRAKTAAKPGRRARISQCLAILWIAAMSTAIFLMGKAFYQSKQKPTVSKEETTVSSILEAVPVAEDDRKKPKMVEDFLTFSEYNRPGTKLERVDNIFVHYTANPGTSAAQNRSYFESLGQTHERAASAHFIIGYDGEIIQCIPLEEEAYAVKERNVDSISIECCYIAEDGSFTPATYDSLIEMLVWLTDKYHLKPEDILRHYDCGGKKCPIYYVEHEDAWQQLLADVEHNL